MSMSRKPYPSDVSDCEFLALVVLYLTLLPEETAQRTHALREVFNGMRYIVKTVAHGALCRTTCRHGRSSTSRRSDG